MAEEVQRKEIVFSRASNDVKEITMTEWTEQLQELINGYNQVIIVMKLLFDTASPDRSLVSRFEECHDTKGTKDRGTVIFTCSFPGNN